MHSLWDILPLELQEQIQYEVVKINKASLHTELIAELSINIPNCWVDNPTLYHKVVNDILNIFDIIEKVQLSNIRYIHLNEFAIIHRWRDTIQLDRSDNVHIDLSLNRSFQMARPPGHPLLRTPLNARTSIILGIICDLSYQTLLSL